MKRKHLKVGQPVWVVARPRPGKMHGAGEVVSGYWLLVRFPMCCGRRHRLPGVITELSWYGGNPRIEVFSERGTTQGEWFVQREDLQVRHVS